MNPVFEKYLKILCETSDFTIEDFLSKNRHRELCSYRHIFWYYMHKYQGFGYYRLGKQSHRNHSTVIHGIKCAEDYLKVPCFRQEKLHYMEFLINISLDKNGNKLLCSQNSLQNKEGIN